VVPPAAVRAAAAARLLLAERPAAVPLAAARLARPRAVAAAARQAAARRATPDPAGPPPPVAPAVLARAVPAARAARRGAAVPARGERRPQRRPTETPRTVARARRAGAQTPTQALACFCSASSSCRSCVAGAVEPQQSRPWRGPTQGGKLLAEGEVLKGELGADAEHGAQGGEQAEKQSGHGRVAHNAVSVWPSLRIHALTDGGEDLRTKTWRTTGATPPRPSREDRDDTRVFLITSPSGHNNPINLA
jgi:hypothetical protein